MQLGPLCYSAGSLKILKEFRANPPVPGARAVSFIDDITVTLPRGSTIGEGGDTTISSPGRSR